LPYNIILCDQIQQVFCLLIYRRFLGALLSSPTGFLLLNSAGDIGPYIGLPWNFHFAYTPLYSRIIAWGSVSDRHLM